MADPAQRSCPPSEPRGYHATGTDVAFWSRPVAGTKCVLWAVPQRLPRDAAECRPGGHAGAFVGAPFPCTWGPVVSVCGAFPMMIHGMETTGTDARHDALLYPHALSV